MLLKRTQNENLIESTYDSSNILSSRYDKEHKKLTITFKRGVQYTYLDVSAADYLRFETAESQGAVLNSHIKSHSFEKGDVVDAKVIQEEIDKLKKEELILMQQSIIDDMESITYEFNTNDKFIEAQLIALSKRIVNYFNPINE